MSNDQAVESPIEPEGNHRVATQSRSGLARLVLGGMCLLAAGGALGACSSNKSPSNDATATTAASSATTTTAASTTSTTFDPTGVTSGSSPAALVTSFLQVYASGDTTKACGYFQTSVASACQSGLSSGGSTTGTTATVANTVTGGNQALVALSGQVCGSALVQNSSANCENVDATTGMPDSSTSFSNAYNAAVTGSAASPVPVQEVNGQWYLAGGN